MNSQKRIVMLANAGHKPLDTRIFQKEAKSLKAAGHEVTLIIPHHENFERDGIQIVAVPLPRKGWEQLIKCPWRIFKKARSRSRDSIFHIHDSELLVVGLLLKILGRKVVYDAHEDTPLQISYQHWIPWLLKRPYALFYRTLEKMAGWWFDAVIVAEPVIAKYFPERKTILIRNFPIVASFSKEPDYAHAERNLVYVGLLSKPRGIYEMLEAHKIANDLTPVKLVLGGKFAPASIEAELLPRYKNVDYRSWLPYDDMITTLYASKIGIIVPHPIERYKTNYPVKLFEYMAAGLPVIASHVGESADFVRAAQGGMTVDPMNVSEISSAIIYLMQHPEKAEEMGRRGRAFVFAKCAWEQEAEKLIALYHSL